MENSTLLCLVKLFQLFLGTLPNLEWLFKLLLAFVCSVSAGTDQISFHSQKYLTLQYGLSDNSRNCVHSPSWLVL